MDADTTRWIRNSADRQAADAGCVFDAAAAEHAAAFFPTFLCHSKGEWGGQPFELQSWQRDDIIYPLFGWKRPDGTRRFRKAYVELPKKNGKSTLAAGVGLYLSVGDGEPGAEVYSAATDQVQASIVHGEAIHMVEASPALMRELDINRSTKSISHPASKSVYRSLSSEAAGKEGLNAHGIIADELHVWHGRKLWDALKYAFRSRRQGLLFIITTAGEDEESVCKEEHDYAEGVLSGAISDPRYFAYIRAAQPDDDWTDPAVWEAANPGWGVTVKADDFAADCEEAKRKATAQASFKRYSLNIWGTNAVSWLAGNQWDACQDSFDAESLAGKPCVAGLDLARSRDMTSFVLLFREGDTYRLLPWFFLPEDTINDPGSPDALRKWRQSGHLIATPGNVCDYALVRQAFLAASKKYKIREVAYDPYNAEQLTQELESQAGVARVAFAQTITNFASPTAEFERLVLSEQLKHNGHPVLAWQARNTKVRVDANQNMRPVKPAKHDKRTIDGIVASIMALARAMEVPISCVYESRGLLAV